MKVVISVKLMQSGSKNRGIGAYTRELVGALTSRFPSDKFIPTSHEYYNLGADLVHFPFFDPFFLTLPLFHRLPMVVTIHDLIPLKYPRHFPRGLRGSLKWQVQKLAVKKADHLITDSVASQKDIVRILGVDPSKVAVIPLGPSGDKLDLKQLPLVQKTYHLPEKYLLYVGDVNWNKNVPGLIKAFAELKDDDVHLVLVGKTFLLKANLPELKAVNRAIQSSGKKERIHLLGYVPPSHLPAIFKLATLYVQPSWDEGFGLPLLEAMLVGCPVVSSDKGSLPEVGGDAVAYFDPAENMSAVIGKVLSSPKLRSSLTEKGREQVKKFNWQVTAQATRSVYEKVLAAK